MTPEQVRGRVRDIEAMTTEAYIDHEVAHSEEDKLHQEVLSAIADGACSDPKACAEEALKTLALKFERWCA